MANVTSVNHVSYTDQELENAFALARPKFASLHGYLKGASDAEKTASLKLLYLHIAPQLAPGETPADNMTTLFAQTLRCFATETEKQEAMRHMHEQFSLHCPANIAALKPAKNINIEINLDLNKLKEKVGEIGGKIKEFKESVERECQNIERVAGAIPGMNTEQKEGNVEIYHRYYENNVVKNANDIAELIRAQEEIIKESESNTIKSIKDLLAVNENIREQVEGLFKALAAPTLAAHEIASHGGQYWLAHSQNFDPQVKKIKAVEAGEITVTESDIEKCLNDNIKFNITFKAFKKELKEFLSTVTTTKELLLNKKYVKHQKEVVKGQGFQKAHEALEAKWQLILNQSAENDEKLAGIQKFYSEQLKGISGTLTSQIDEIALTTNAHRLACKHFAEATNIKTLHTWDEYSLSTK